LLSTGLGTRAVSEVEQAPVEATKSSGKDRGKWLLVVCSPSPRLLLLFAELPPVCSSLPSLSLHTEAQVAIVPVDRLRDPRVGFGRGGGDISGIFLKRTTLCGEDVSSLSAVSSKPASGAVFPDLFCCKCCR
jgi:hypothetical protein